MAPFQHTPRKRRAKQSGLPSYKRPDREVKYCGRCETDRAVIHFGNLNPNTNITKYAATFINCRLIAEVKSALKSTDIDAISLEGFLEILRARFRKLDLYLERSVEAWDISLSDDRVQEVKQSLASVSHVKIPKNVNVAALAAVDSEDSTILSLHTNTDGPVVASNSANGTQDKTVATNDASNEHHTRPDPTNKPGLTNRPGSTNSMQDTSEATLSDLLNRLIARQEQSQRDSEKHNSALITAVNTMNAHLATISKQLSNVDNETVEAAQHAHVLKELLEAVRTMHKNDNRSVDSTRREVEGEISMADTNTAPDARSSPTPVPRSTTSLDIEGVGSTYFKPAGSGPKSSEASSGVGTQQDHGKASDTSSGYLKKCTDKVMAGKYTSGQQNPGVRKTTKKGASRKKAVGKKARAKNSGETGKIDDPNVMEVDKPFEMNDGDITMRSANSNDAQKVTQDAQSDNDATEEADQTKQFHFGSDEDM